MLTTRLIHPQILSALASAGHASKVLIADGNYPFSTRLGPKAQIVFLNLMPGITTCTQVLEALVTAVPIEAAQVMEPMRAGQYAMKNDPPIWKSFRKILDGAGIAVPLEKVERFKFYDVAGAPDVALTIATGETAVYANLLLTIGAIVPK
ncbi:MAG: RbsD/FucU family protein [Phycisphaeraceae bacterium]|nr:RbsD/FucU family protein [Phycisphaeraceae bacterium]